MHDNAKTRERTAGEYKGWVESQLFVAAFNPQEDVRKSEKEKERQRDICVQQLRRDHEKAAEREWLFEVAMLDKSAK